MQLPSLFLPFFLLQLLQPCSCNPISSPKALDTSGIQSDQLAHNIHTPILKRDDSDGDNDWRLVHHTTYSVIQPIDIGAASMSQFYHLLFQAALGGWRQRQQPRLHLQIVWRRVAMIIIAQGLESIPWELVAQFAQGMINWVNNGQVAFTYDGYYLKQSETIWPYGLYVGVRIVGEQEAVDNYLAAGRGQVLDPSNP
ncbi:MAG: hypothetical protein Q9178_002834 [Gyalolechia marmorata]